MKKILILVLLFIYFFFYNANSTGPCTCPSNPCYESDNSCNCTQWSPWAHKMYNYMVPDFPLCTLLVEVCYRQCVAPSALCVQNDICSISILNSCGTACDPFLGYMNTGDGLEKSRKWMRLKVNIFRFVSREWFRIYHEENPNVLFPCDLQHERLKITMFQTACATVCNTQFPYFDPSIKNYTEFKTCSDQFCCKIVESFCLNDDNTINQTETVTRGGAPDCNGMELPLTVCVPGENVSILPCIDPCEDY